MNKNNKLDLKNLNKINKSDILKASQKVNKAFIKGVLTLKENLVIVIDLERLFDNLLESKAEIVLEAT
ncbi:MAG: hypothetical protein ACQERL_08730 [Bacillota bacterium]